MITNTAAVCTWWPSLPILRAAIHPLFGKFTVVLNVIGAPGATDACWLATTTPLLTSSIVPVKFCVAVHCTTTGRLAAAANWISSPGESFRSLSNQEIPYVHFAKLPSARPLCRRSIPVGQLSACNLNVSQEGARVSTAIAWVVRTCRKTWPETSVKQLVIGFDEAFRIHRK